MSQFYAKRVTAITRMVTSAEDEAKLNALTEILESGQEFIVSYDDVYYVKHTDGKRLFPDLPKSPADAPPDGSVGTDQLADGSVTEAKLDPALDTKINDAAKSANWGSIDGTLSNQADLKSALDAKVESSTIGQPGGPAGPLGGDGKLPAGQLPPLEHDSDSAASEAEMLALDVTAPAMCVRTDFSPAHVFFLTADPATEIANWHDVGAFSAAGAAPTAKTGLNSIAGTAPTYMRSDGAPALDQSISPTWTGSHTFGQDIQMSQKKVTGLADGADPSDAVNKQQLDSKVDTSGKATEAEAQAGTDDEKWMTPLKTAQAIAAQVHGGSGSQVDTYILTADVSASDTTGTIVADLSHIVPDATKNEIRIIEADLYISGAHEAGMRFWLNQNLGNITIQGGAFMPDITGSPSYPVYWQQYNDTDKNYIDPDDSNIRFAQVRWIVNSQAFGGDYGSLTFIIAQQTSFASPVTLHAGSKLVSRLVSSITP